MFAITESVAWQCPDVNRPLFEIPLGKCCLIFICMCVCVCGGYSGSKLLLIHLTYDLVKCFFSSFLLNSLYQGHVHLDHEHFDNRIGRGCRIHKTHPRGVLDIILSNLMRNVNQWSFEKCRVRLHSHCSHILSGPQRWYLIETYQWVI